ncbi:MAG: LamG-like jellyroll fold domain-containing protein, partial [Planctomycetota bacterium]
QWVAGKIDGALELDGVDDCVDCGNDLSLDITGEMTIAAWIYPTGGGSSNFPRIVDKSNGTGGAAPGYKIYLRAAENYVVTLSAGGTYLNSTSSASLNAWNYVAFIITPSQWRSYLNGTWEEYAVTLPSSSTNPLFIGNSPAGARHFNGSIDEVRIYNRALTQEEIQKAMRGAPPGLASNPKPDDGAIDVPRDVTLSWTPGEFAPPVNGHKVYLSDNFNDVNDGIGGIAQDANSYTRPQRLDFGTTYYWRVDEVNGPPDYTVYQGDIWQFTCEPFSRPIENVVAAASSSDISKGPENTVNGSGLDDSGLLHDKVGDDTMWLSDVTGSQPAWIEFQFDKVYKLHEMWVWNSNESLEQVIGFGFKDVSIEYSVNGTDYTTLGTTHEFARAPGVPGYAHNTTVDFGGVGAKYVRLTANSNWDG